MEREPGGVGEVLAGAALSQQRTRSPGDRPVQPAEREADDHGPGTPDRAQLQLAELYESEGKAKQAKDIYASLKDKDAKGPAGAIATEKLNPEAAGPQVRMPQ